MYTAAGCGPVTLDFLSRIIRQEPIDVPTQPVRPARHRVGQMRSHASDRMLRTMPKWPPAIKGTLFATVAACEYRQRATAKSNGTLDPTLLMLSPTLSGMHICSFIIKLKLDL
ncbi:hypothetical protein CTI12_AA228160 [Artemisia annua]|uniref:Uncharacterized protein n=1 Tax=Artemisia annua TaxID=35608 RepID=A0A2U1NUF8_ARTAN|nr:hypothetical protein CTI12_AA228160 [Artemisia annua]